MFQMLYFDLCESSILTYHQQYDQRHHKTDVEAPQLKCTTLQVK